MRYKYTVYGKERHIDTGVHPISMHYTLIGAIITCALIWRKFTKLRIA